MINFTLKGVGSKVFKKTESKQSWELSPYPDGFKFAFTIIHDADDAYSKRLAPLIDTFDELGMKITVSMFVFPGNSDFEKRNRQFTESIDKEKREFFGPRNIPLTDKTERKFYKEIAVKGHEIAMHTPSVTANTRQQHFQAFDVFKNIMGSFPKVYVEHGKKWNKETQWNEGSDPKSSYYITDLLNRFGCWVWVDCPGGLTDPRNKKFYDIIASSGTPFCEYSLLNYGIVKGFVRSGKWENSNGDGFLDWYSEENIDLLEKERGLALVYTHLDKKWIDPETQHIRESIKNRLIYIASKDGWFAPVGQILDRFEAMKKVYLLYNNKWLKVINANPFALQGLTLISHNSCSLIGNNSKILTPNEDNEILIGALTSFETASFEILFSDRDR